VNLPNAITVGRIAITPLIAVLPLFESWELRLIAFVLYLAAAITDYYDGMLARTRGLVTDLGKQLDPLADKLLLVGTLVPMYLLQRAPVSAESARALAAVRDLPGPGVGLGPLPESLSRLPFVTPLGLVPLPLWVLLVVLGRELFMTLFRSAAARRGTVIAAIGPAKWKTGFQSTWVGTAFFWFFSASLAARYALWGTTAWRAFALFNGVVGALTMAGAVVLTIYSLLLYLRRYGGLFMGKGVGSRV
jgi:CDP-diacylglycerol---glycerol-3-phosphate 3-phosphatidyltransferase